MNRLKFLLFAVAALGLWGYHLVFSPAAALRLSEQGAGSVSAAAPSLALVLEAQRSELQAALLRAAGTPLAWNVGPKAPAKPEAPTADRYAQVRAAVMEGLGEANKSSLVLLLSNEQGSLLGQGPGEPAAPAEGFDVASLSNAGGVGALSTYNGATYLFFSTPMLISDKNEVRTAGTIALGVPLLPDSKRLEALAKDLKLVSLAVVASGKVVLAAGSNRALAETALKALKAGQVAAVISGSVRSVGPLALPLFVEGAAQAMGARQVIAGTPFEVIAVASTREPLDALASFQLFGVGGLAGLFLLALVVTLLIKAGGDEDEEGGGMVVPPPLPVPPVRKEPEVIAPKPSEPGHAGPEASPDDFHFPPAPTSSMNVSSPSATHATSPLPPPVPGNTGQNPVLTVGMTNAAPTFSPNGPTVPGFAMPPALGDPPAPSYPPPPVPSQPDEDPFALGAPAPPPATRGGTPSSVRPARPTPIFEAQDEQERTVAYPAFKPPPPTADPFMMTTPAQHSGMTNYDDSPDATRVAAVPQELIKAARGGTGNTGEKPALKVSPLPKVQSVPSVAPAGDPEERHFQDIFREFVSTREKCGEPADGLTFEKFKGKLLKNKEQLVAKYQCRSVRFQVYVKEGKAALKATPVKD